MWRRSVRCWVSMTLVTTALWASHAALVARPVGASDADVYSAAILDRDPLVYLPLDGSAVQDLGAVSVPDRPAFDVLDVRGDASLGHGGAIAGGSSMWTDGVDGGSAPVSGVYASEGGYRGPWKRIASPSVTYEAWFKTDQLPTGPTGRSFIVSTGYTENATHVGLNMWIDASGALVGHVKFGVVTGVMLTSGPRSVVDGEWHHVALTFDESTGTSMLVVDGLVEHVAVTPGETLAWSAPYRRLVLGHNASIGVGLGGWSRYGAFHGYIDDFAVYGSALPVEDLRENYVDSGRPEPWWWDPDHPNWNDPGTAERFGPNAAMRYQCPCQGTTDNSIDTWSGNEHVALPGVTVPGRGVDLGFDLAYNTMNQAEPAGPLGRGVSASFGMRLRGGGPGVVELVQETGATVPFRSVGNGRWSAPGRFAAEMEHVSDRWVVTRGGLERLSFDELGRLRRHEDLHGQGVELWYTGSSGELSYIRDDSGRRLDFSWQGGFVESIDDLAGGRQAVFTYAGDRLVEYVDMSGGVWTLSYEASGRLTGYQRPRHAGSGLAWSFGYDAVGRVVWEEDELGRRTTVQYDTPVAGASTVTMPTGAKRVDWHDSKGRRWKVSEGYGTPEQVDVEYTYDEVTFGPTAVVDGRGKVWSYGFDADGNRDLVVDPTGRRSEYDYNDLGQVVEQRVNHAPPGEPPVWVTTTMIYSATGLLESVVEDDGGPDEAVTELEYGSQASPSDLVSVVDPNGNEWSFEYLQGSGDLVTAVNPEGDTAAWTYDAVGRIVTADAPNGRRSGSTPSAWRTTYTYDDGNRVTSESNPLGEKTTYAYDASGLLLHVDTSVGPGVHDSERLVHSYDAADQLISTSTQAVIGGVPQPAVAVDTFAYWGDGTRKTWTNGAGGQWQYFYDALGRLVTSVDPVGNTTVTDYDGQSNVVAVTQPGAGSTCASTPKVNCITYTYDDAGRVATVVYSDPGTPDTLSTSYDGVGRRVATARDDAASETWSWDRLGRQTSHTDAANRTTTYGWDEVGNLVSIGYPDRPVPVTYSYDDAGRMDAVTDWDGRETTFEHDSNGNWLTTVFPATTENVDERTYDRADRLSSVTWSRGAAELGGFTYDRDSEGALTLEAPKGSHFDEREFGYDPADRLTQVDAATLEVDDAGNLTVTEDGRAQVFDPAQRLCWTSPTATGGDCQTPPADATSYSYDARGNRTAMTYPSGTQAVYGYDQNNQMTTAVVPDQGLSTDGQYRPVPATTAVDTTIGTGTCDAGTCARLPASSTTEVEVTGVGAVPGAGDVVAVTGTLTVVDPAGDGRVEVNPDGGAAAATVFYDSGVDATVSFVAPTDANGQITVATSAAADVVVDVSGYHTTEAFVPSFNYWPTDAAVLADTATGTGVCDAGACATLAADQTVEVAAAGQGEVPADATAVVVSVVATGHTGDGTVRVTPNGAAAAGTLFLEANVPSSAVVTAPVDGNGDITVHSSVAGDVAVHVSGWYASPDLGDGDEGHALDLLPAPARIAESAAGTGVCDGGTCTALGVNDSIDVAVAGQAGVPADAAAAVVNVTVTGTTTGLVGLGVDGAAAAAVHLVRTGVDSAFTATVPLDPDGTVTLTSGLGAQAEFAIDVVGAYTPAVDTWTYTYDATGLRTAKQANGDVPTSYTWNTAAGVPLLLTQHRGTSRHDIVYGPNGTPLYQVNPDDTVLYYHQDHQGSTRLTTGPNGNPRGRRTYTAYGAIATDTHPIFGHQPILGYTGEQHDTDTGYIYLRARHHDPLTGQFTSRDPIAPLTGDPYSYASANPANLTDPLGLCSINPFSSDNCIGAVGGVVEDVVEVAPDAWDYAYEVVTDNVDDAWDFTYRNRGTIATIGAIGTCLIPAVGFAGCAYAAGAAFVARSSERIEDHGFRDSLGANLADGALTYLTLGLGGAFESAGQGLSPGLSYLGRLVPAGYDVTSLFIWLDELC